MPTLCYIMFLSCLLELNHQDVVFFVFFFNNVLCSLSFFSSLEEDPLYIAYADMMAKVLHFLHCFDSVAFCSAKSCRRVIVFSLSELRWRWRRGRWGRKGENLRGASGFSGTLFCISLCFLFLYIEKCFTPSNRKRKWRSKRCCTSKPDYMTEELQRWCFRWSVPAKVGILSTRQMFQNCQPQYDAVTVWWTVVIRSTWCYGDFHPKTGHLHPQRGEHSSPAGKRQSSGMHVARRQTPSAHFLLRLCLDAENAGLPEGKTRCWIFQKFVRTHDVVQVTKPKPDVTNQTRTIRFLFCWWRFLVIQVYIHLMYPGLSKFRYTCWCCSTVC